MLISSERFGAECTINGTTTVCQNAGSPNLTFEGIGGTTPYTFTYTINDVAQLPVTTSGANTTIIIPAPTTTVGTFIYQLISATDGGGNSCSITAPLAIITVITKPDPAGTIAGPVSVCPGPDRSCLYGSCNRVSNSIYMDFTGRSIDHSGIKYKQYNSQLIQHPRHQAI